MAVSEVYGFLTELCLYMSPVSSIFHTELNCGKPPLKCIFRPVCLFLLIFFYVVYVEQMKKTISDQLTVRKAPVCWLKDTT